MPMVTEDSRTGIDHSPAVSAGEPYVVGCKSRAAMDVHATPPTGPRGAARDRAYDRLNPNSPLPTPGGEGGELLRTLIARDPDGLLVVGRNDNIIHFANPAAAALLGRPGADLRGERLGARVAPAQTVEWE